MTATVRDYSLGHYFDGANYGLLRHALEHDLMIDGYGLEFGVQTGTSLGYIAAKMPAVGFDSFSGLPEFWRKGFPRGSLKQTKLPMIGNSRLVIGWFEDTLPVFDFNTVDPIALVHLDADLYSSTATALRWVGPHLKPGTVLVFDEWWGYPDAEDHEQRAFKEYAEASDIEWQVIGHSDQGWGIRIV